jgi:hypothetical protein
MDASAFGLILFGLLRHFAELPAAFEARISPFYRQIARAAMLPSRAAFDAHGIRLKAASRSFVADKTRQPAV